MPVEEPPRIAIFLPTLDGGGAERVMVRLANTFEGRGYPVDLLLANVVGPWLTDLRPGVQVLELGGRGVLTALPALIRYMRRMRPQALLSTLDHANLVAIWGRSIARTSTRIVVRQAADPSGDQSSSLADIAIDRLMGPSYRRADHVVVLADAMKRSMVSTKRLNPDRVSVIPNPVSIDDILTLAQQDPADKWLTDTATASAGPLVVAAGRLKPQKDFPTLLRAVATVAKHMPVRLAVLGDGPDRAALASLAVELGIDQITCFPGFQANPYPWFARADVVVLSSIFEGLPNVLLEALALGRPVVATDCPTGPHEILEAGRLGTLVPIGDAAALARGIEAVLAGDRPAPSVLRAAASSYAVDDIGTRYLDVLLPGTGHQHGA